MQEAKVGELWSEAGPGKNTRPYLKKKTEAKKSMRALFKL
jgi:hypothetical protein